MAVFMWLSGGHMLKTYREKAEVAELGARQTADLKGPGSAAEGTVWGLGL